MFLYTGYFRRDYHTMAANQVNFVRPPHEEEYGTVAVFEDLYGPPGTYRKEKNKPDAFIFYACAPGLLLNVLWILRNYPSHLLYLLQTVNGYPLAPALPVHCELQTR